MVIIAVCIVGLVCLGAGYMWGWISGYEDHSKEFDTRTRQWEENYRNQRASFKAALEKVIKELC